MNLELLKAQLPSSAKDISLNLSSILTDQSAVRIAAVLNAGAASI
ncbi:MAG: hypothetical protein Q7V63_07630 [Gammaproteobacteria bacterium]|nr:hypothetical protein [Gammaproteobacteria bacterium]